MTSPAFPTAFEQYMKNRLGDSWNTFATAHAHAAPVSIRINPAKPVPDNDSLEKMLWTQYGRYLKERPVFTLDPLFHAGAYYVQEASSMLLEQALKQTAPLNEPLRVLDLCAAPGGKSTHALSLLNSNSLLVSNEVIRSRVHVLAENLQKWGSPNVVVTNNDPEDFQALAGAFDVIIVDAPCSGEGLFRKDTKAMEEWSEHQVALCSSRQKRILSDVWPALKENGLLIYSTCTYNALENEDNLVWLQQHHPVEFLSLKLPESWGFEEVKKDRAIGYRSYPHRVRGEGFFLSVVRKKQQQAEIITKAGKPLFEAPSRKILEEIKPWVMDPEGKAFIQRDAVIQFFPARHLAFIEQIARKLRINYAGTFLATAKHNKLIPEHTLALSTAINRDHFFNVSLSAEEAIRYLRRESLPLELPHRGFALAHYNNIPIGWMNVIPGRINNLYPSEWRIRMAAS